MDLLDPHLKLLDYSEPQLEGMILAMSCSLRTPAKCANPHHRAGTPVRLVRVLI